jgi:hypothetical protein
LIEPDLKKNPILRQLPLTLPDCQKCNASGHCEVLAILRAEEPGVMALTYAKLEALMLSRGKIAKEILVKLSSAEVVMLDEAHVLSLPSSVSVWAFASLRIPDKYKALGRVYQKWLAFCQSHLIRSWSLWSEPNRTCSSTSLKEHIQHELLEWRELKTCMVTAPQTCNGS